MSIGHGILRSVLAMSTAFVSFCYRMKLQLCMEYLCGLYKGNLCDVCRRSAMI